LTTANAVEFWNVYLCEIFETLMGRLIVRRTLTENCSAVLSIREIF